jgi:hypothetical protein
MLASFVLCSTEPAPRTNKEKLEIRPSVPDGGGAMLHRLEINFEDGNCQKKYISLRFPQRMKDREKKH